MLGGLTAASWPLIARAQSDQPVIRIANLDIGPFAPVAYVGKVAAKHGIKVQITGFRRGLESAQAVAADAADVGVGGLEAAVSAVAAGSPSVIVAGCTTGGIGWVAKKGSGIRFVPSRTTVGEAAVMSTSSHAPPVFAPILRNNFQVIDSQASVQSSGRSLSHCGESGRAFAASR